MPLLFDWTIFIIIPPLILALWAQTKVKHNYLKYSKLRSNKGYTGEQVARELLRINGITDVKVAKVPGELTDHYDPRTKTIRLSDNIYSSTSVSALSIAAHETGHALQHNQNYAPLGIRSALVPAVNIGSNSAMPLFMLGILLTAFGGSVFGQQLMLFGIILFTAVVLFQIVTLPVEFNASSRAIAMLQSNNFLDSTEIKPAKEVLNAAALTYVAAAASTLASLLRLIIIYSRNKR